MIFSVVLVQVIRNKPMREKGESKSLRMELAANNQGLIKQQGQK